MPMPTTTAATTPSVLKELMNRGLSESHARRLLQSLPEGQCVLDQLEYGDWVIAKSKKAIMNPPGFYIYLLRENVIPPDSFESSSSRLAKAALEETKGKEERNRLHLEHEYKQFCEERVTIYVETEMDRGDYEERLQQKMHDVKAAWPRLPAPSMHEIAGRALRADLYATVALPSFEEFCRRHRQMPLFKAETPPKEPA
jgi:hypothetical protein